MNIERKYGWVPDLPDHRDFLFAQEEAIVLPKEVNLITKMPSVYDQYTLGSCTANGIGGCVEAGHIIQGLPPFRPSRLFIYFNERKEEGTVNSDSGAQIRDGIKSVATLGSCSETDWPYIISKFKTKPSVKCYKSALKDLVLKYERLSGITSYNTALAKGYPFVFGMSVYESFESASVAKTGIVPMPLTTESNLGGHCVMGIGYNDKLKSFICRNSWGDKWGVKGYFFLPYNYFNSSLTDDFWVIYTVE